MLNDDLSEIDAQLSRDIGLSFEQAKKLRAQLAENAARAVTRDKRMADMERELDRLRAIVAAGVDREAAYALVERELRPNGYAGPRVTGMQWHNDGVCLECEGQGDADGETLIEAVNALKAQAGGEHG